MLARSMGIFMPISPAPPQMSAHRLHRVEAATPSETSVSMVKAPCRSPARAVRWKGHAPQVTTGSVRAASAHCQPVNWRAELIEMAMTGTESTRLRIRRRRRSSARTRWEAPSEPRVLLAAADSAGALSVGRADGSSGEVDGLGSAGASALRAATGPARAAEYPARATVAMSSSSVTESGTVRWADSVARLTLASTPSILRSFFSTRATQDAQVMPPTARSTSRVLKRCGRRARRRPACSHRPRRSPRPGRRHRARRPTRP